MNPIPKKLLIHTAAAIEKGEPDMWGKCEDVNRTELTFVRVEPSSSLRISKDNNQVQFAAVLFYDCRNSCPAGYDFSHADKIEYNGQQYNILGVKELYDEKKLHHLEVELWV